MIFFKQKSIFLQLSHICHILLLSVVQIYFMDIHVCVYCSYNRWLCWCCCRFSFRCCCVVSSWLGCSCKRIGVCCRESCFNLLLFLCCCCTGIIDIRKNSTGSCRCSALRDTYTYTHAHIHIYIYIYIKTMWSDYVCSIWAPQTFSNHYCCHYRLRRHHHNDHMLLLLILLKLLLLPPLCSIIVCVVVVVVVSIDITVMKLI